MKTIKISHSENKGKKSILVALTILKEYTNMTINDVDKLTKQFGRGGDIYWDVPDKSLNDVINFLRFQNFVYRLEGDFPQYEYFNEDGIDPYVTTLKPNTSDFNKYFSVYDPHKENAIEAALVTSYAEHMGQDFTPRYIMNKFGKKGIEEVLILWSRKNNYIDC